MAIFPAGRLMYLGLDIGTSSVKGVLIDARQKILATASSPLKVSRPHPGWSEQKPEDWWKSVNDVVQRLAKAKPTAMERRGRHWAFRTAARRHAARCRGYPSIDLGDVLGGLILP